MTSYKRCIHKDCNYHAFSGLVPYCMGHWEERIDMNIKVIKEEHKQKP